MSIHPITGSAMYPAQLQLSANFALAPNSLHGQLTDTVGVTLYWFC